MMCGAAPPMNVWVVGRAGTIVHWDGAAWAVVPSPTTVDLADVWGSAANDVWAVGGAILHFDGVDGSQVAIDWRP